MTPLFSKPVLGISALSGTGKTQLLSQLVPQLKQSGLRVAVIKHAHHDIDIDKPGKDSYKMREAGANPVILASKNRIACMIERTPDQDLDLNECLALLNPDSIDLVLVEGFKQLPLNKVFLFRHNIKDRFQELDDNVLRIMNAANTIAIASDIDSADLLQKLPQPKPILDINNISSICEFILHDVNNESTDD